MKLFNRKQPKSKKATAAPIAEQTLVSTEAVPPSADIGYQRLEQRRVLSASFGIGAGGALILDSFDPGQDLTVAQTDSFINGFIQDSFAFEVDSGSFTGSVTNPCLLYTSPSPRDQRGYRMPSSA